MQASGRDPRRVEGNVAGQLEAVIAQHFSDLVDFDLAIDRSSITKDTLAEKAMQILWPR